MNRDERMSEIGLSEEYIAAFTKVSDNKNPSFEDLFAVFLMGLSESRALQIVAEVNGSK